jgi:hypothetical protein
MKTKNFFDEIDEFKFDIDSLKDECRDFLLDGYWGGKDEKISGLTRILLEYKNNETIDQFSIATSKATNEVSIYIRETPESSIIVNNITITKNGF